MYSYTGNNPINYVDPTGHCGLLAAILGGAAIGAVVGAAVTFIGDVADGYLDAIWQDYAGAMVTGAIIGAAAPVASAAIASGAVTLSVAMLGMGLAGAEASITEQMITTGQVDYVKAFREGAETVFSFGILHTVSQAISRALTGGNSSTLKPSRKNYVTMKEGSYQEAYGSKNIEFTKTTAIHMDDPNRYVPVQLMEDVIKNGTAYPDPHGSSGNMYYSELYRNSKLYNLEILYDKSINTIQHFMYSTDSMGSLPAIK